MQGCALYDTVTSPVRGDRSQEGHTVLRKTTGTREAM